MKLHLPRVLLATIFAAFALAPSAWGGEWGTYGDSTAENAYYVGTAEEALDITAGDHSGITSLYLTPQGEVTSSTVTGVNLKTGDTLNIVGNGTTNFAGLTIGSVSVKESGTATLNVETGQTATISAINGTLNTTVTGTLTLDSESNITLGTVSVGTNTNKVGKLVLNSAVNVTGTLTGWGGELEIGAKDIVINHLSLGERGNAQSKILIRVGIIRH